MSNYLIASFMIIISLISLTIYYMLQLTTLATPCEGIQTKHLFLSHINVAFIALLLPTLAKRVKHD